MMLLLGDCLEIMPTLQSGSVDMVLCDLPYGNQTNNHWDIGLPLDRLWTEYERVLKRDGAVVLFGNSRFTSELMQSNKKMWRYNLVWDKVLITGFLNANKMPLRVHEDICVFYRVVPIYNPQKYQGTSKCHRRVTKVHVSRTYGTHAAVDNSEKHGTMKHPTSILRFEKDHPSVSVHPTQKPVALLEFLVKSYTNEGQTVLDNCMGSGSTGVACVRTGRDFIGIEKNKSYFNIAKGRIHMAGRK